MFEHTSDIIFLVGFVVYIVTRGIYASRTKSLETVEKRVDAMERVLLVFVMIGSLLLPILYLFTPLLNFANHVVPDWAIWIGAVVLMTALWLFWRSHADLGQNWSPTLEIRSEHRLVTCGVYRTMRHPMYTAIFLFSIAQALLLNNWIAGFSAFATFFPLYVVRRPREERMMIDQFGEEYEAYMKRSRRLFPRFKTNK